MYTYTHIQSISIYPIVPNLQTCLTTMQFINRLIEINNQIKNRALMLIIKQKKIV